MVRKNVESIVWASCAKRVKILPAWFVSKNAIGLSITLFVMWLWKFLDT